MYGHIDLWSRHVQSASNFRAVCPRQMMNIKSGLSVEDALEAASLRVAWRYTPPPAGTNWSPPSWRTSWPLTLGIPTHQRWARFYKNVSIEAIPMLYFLGKVSIKRLYRFKSQKFWMMKRYKYFYAKNLNRQSICIVSNPRIFKGEAIQVLLRQKIWIVKAIVSFQTPEFLKMKGYKYLN